MELQYIVLHSILRGKQGQTLFVIRDLCFEIELRIRNAWVRTCILAIVNTFFSVKFLLWVFLRLNIIVFGSHLPQRRGFFSCNVGSMDYVVLNMVTKRRRGAQWWRSGLAQENWRNDGTASERAKKEVQESWLERESRRLPFYNNVYN